MKKYTKYLVGGGFIAGICIKLVSGGGPDRGPASVATNTDCQPVLEYFQKAGVKVETSKSSGLIYSGDVRIKGPGILSSKPVSVMCSKSGSVTIFGTDIKVERKNASAAVKALSPIFLLAASSVQASESQKDFFSETAWQLQSSSDWLSKVEGNFVVRVMTVQADVQGNYLLNIHSGNSASYKQ